MKQWVENRKKKRDKKWLKKTKLRKKSRKAEENKVKEKDMWNRLTKLNSEFKVIKEA